MVHLVMTMIVRKQLDLVVTKIMVKSVIQPQKQTVDPIFPVIANGIYVRIILKRLHGCKCWFYVDTDDKIDLVRGQTRLGVSIKIEELPLPVINNYQFFYICEMCGKMYYDGTHFERVLKGRLQGIVQ